MKIRASWFLAVAWLGVMPAQAQLDPPYEVTASRAIRDHQGYPLGGGGPGEPVPSGCAVHILSVGPDGRADPPDPSGQPGGDDVLLHVTAIGAGMAPNRADTGRFAVSFHPPPRAGSLVYVRVFNHVTAARASHYGDSRPAAAVPLEVLDVSAWGLVQTSQAMPRPGAD